MIKNLTFILFAVLVIVYQGCSCGCSEKTDNYATDFTLKNNNYKFVMIDSLDSKILEGTLAIESKKADAFSGSYKLTNVYQKDFPGLGSMFGKFEGKITDNNTKGYINTSPKIADNNVFFNFSIKQDTLTGDWHHSVFRSGFSKGFFQAVPVK